MSGWRVSYRCVVSVALFTVAVACGASEVSTSTAPLTRSGAPASTAKSAVDTPDKAWSDHASSECTKILDDFAKVPRDQSPEFLDRRAEMAEKLAASVQSGSPPADLRQRIGAFVSAMQAQARYDHQAATALRSQGPAPTPPTGEPPTLGVACGNSTI